MWVWQTWEGAAVCLLGVSSSSRVLEPDLSPPAATNWCPQTTLVFCPPNNTKALNVCPYVYVWLLTLISTANCIQFKSIFWRSWFIITILIVGVIIRLFRFLFFPFFFLCKEILKHGILTAAENFVNNAKMEGDSDKNTKL